MLAVKGGRASFRAKNNNSSFQDLAGRPNGIGLEPDEFWDVQRFPLLRLRLPRHLKTRKATVAEEE